MALHKKLADYTKYSIVVKNKNANCFYSPLSILTIMQQYHTLCILSELYCHTVRFLAAMWSVHLKVDNIEPSISHACEIQQNALRCLPVIVAADFLN